MPRATLPPSLARAANHLIDAQTEIARYVADHPITEAPLEAVLHGIEALGYVLGQEEQQASTVERRRDTRTHGPLSRPAVAAT